MEKKKRLILPKYAYIPLMAAFTVNIAVYMGTKLISAGWPHHSIAIGLDAMIPFIPAFVSFYILAYVQWGVGYIMIGRAGREFCYRIVAGDIAAKLICFVFFVAYPTAIDRPEITGSGLWDNLTRIIYFMDTPVNLFPSIHCLESWICYRGAKLSPKSPAWYTNGMLILTLLVCASTVLVKQHYVLDIAGGILAAEAGLFLAKKFDLGRAFKRLEPPFAKDILQDAE